MRLRALLPLAALVCSLAAASATGAGVSAPHARAAQAKLPTAVWGLELGAQGARTIRPARLLGLRKAGLNALVVDPLKVKPATIAALRRKAARARLLVLVPRRVKGKTLRRARASGGTLTIQRVAGAKAAAAMKRSGRVLALARLVPNPKTNKAAWRAAIRAARSRPNLDLAVTPVGKNGQAALAAYLALLAEQEPGTSSPQPPGSPPPGPPPPPPPPSRPAPVPDKPASVWVSTIGNDATCARLDPSRPCKGFEKAYALAQPGEQIEVAAGTYGKLFLPPEAVKNSAEDVVFRPAPLATVTLGCDSDLSDCIEIENKHVTVKNMRTADYPPVNGLPRQGGVCICRGSDDVTLYNIDAGYFYTAADNASFIAGDYGPVVDQVSKIEYGVDRPPENIVIDGVFVHDHRGVDRHPECLAFYAGSNVTIRNSRFNNCEVFGIFLAPGNDHSDNVLVENNFFSNTGDVSMSAHIKTRSSGSCSNLMFRHNTFVDKNVISECPGPNVRWESNVMTNGGCPAVGTADYNVVLSGKCGAHDVVVSDLGLVDRNGLDFHLRADSPARGRGNPASGATDDIDGNGRPNPAGSPPDAGADERG